MKKQNYKQTINKEGKNTMKLGCISHKYRLAVVGMSTLLLSVVAYGLVSPAVSEAQAETNISVGTSGYTLSVASSTQGRVDMAINPTAAGAFTMTKETLTTKTNAEGFSMYIGMSGDSNNLYINGDTSRDALPATNNGVASYNSPKTISTNSWGYAIPQSATMPIDGGTLINNNLASGNGFSTGSYIENSDTESDTKWAPVPVKGSEQIVQSTNSANNTTGVDLNVFYATKVNSSQTAGIYQGTVVYTAVAKSNNALIASSAPSTTKKMDGGDTITVTIGTNTPYANLTTKTITIVNDDSSDECIITNGGNNPDGSLYLTCTTPAKTLSGYYNINIDLGSYGTYSIANGIEYVYMKKDLFTIATMQEMSPEICRNTTTPLASVTSDFDTDGSHSGDNHYIPSKTLIDARDDQEYTVRKLADGNCWMTENLRYGSTTSNAARAYTSSDAALSDNVNTTKMANLTTSRICTTNSGCKTPGNVDMFSRTGDNYTMPYIAIYQANTAADYDSQTKYGVIYNYCAASGGTVCTDDSVQDATGSICPKGWTLPDLDDELDTSGSASASYNKLTATYGIDDSSTGFDKMVATPLSFLRSGIFNEGSLYRGTSGDGYWWSSKAVTSLPTYSFNLYLDSSGARRFGFDWFIGISVRCVSSS